MALQAFDQLEGREEKSHKHCGSLYSEFLADRSIFQAATRMICHAPVFSKQRHLQAKVEDGRPKHCDFDTQASAPIHSGLNEENQPRSRGKATLSTTPTESDDFVRGDKSDLVLDRQGLSHHTTISSPRDNALSSTISDRDHETMPATTRPSSSNPAKTELSTPPTSISNYELYSKKDLTTDELIGLHRVKTQYSQPGDFQLTSTRTDAEQRQSEREVIPPEERNFHAISRSPPEFCNGYADPECADSLVELTAAAMGKRYCDDYISRADGLRIIEEWVDNDNDGEGDDGEDLHLQEKVQVVNQRKSTTRYWERARAKFAECKAGICMRCRKMVQGNSLS